MRRALIVALLALTGCRDPKLGTKACGQDSDCGSPAASYRCEPQTGVCYCRTDDACPASQFCNTVGFCQDRSGCSVNADCLDPSLFCDAVSGSCLARGRCTSDLQCALGSVCDVARSSCVAGCRTAGDCSGSSCRCGDVACACSGSTPEELARCTIGECDSNFCAGAEFCAYGERCGVVDAGANPRAACFSDYDSDVRPYCDSCRFGGGLSVCGTGANFCLVDTRNAGSYYCGADCSEGQSCPRGYGCQDVVVVSSQWQCSRANPGCPTNTELPCSSDSDCKRGGSCVKLPGAASGSCAGKCGVDEGDLTGFCSCQVDSDCAQETCTTGECSISRKKCVNDIDCRSIRCVDFAGGGGCLIGQNCAPNDGLSCIEVR